MPFAGHNEIGYRPCREQLVADKRNVNLMIYKGIIFNIVQSIEPGVWKWSVSNNEGEAKTGQTKTKPDAVIAAWRAIDKALEPKNRPAAMVR
jgi:hypothetical protein